MLSTCPLPSPNITGWPPSAPPLLLELIKTEGSAAHPDLHGTAQQPINRLLPEEEGRYLPFIFAQCAGNYDRHRSTNEIGERGVGLRVTSGMHFTLKP